MACLDPRLAAPQPADLDGPAPSARRRTTLIDILPELLRRVASHVHPNEVAGSLRLTCKAVSQHLADFTAISCKNGAPVPAHALVWKWIQPEAVRGLTQREREAVAARTVETGCLDAVRRLVTGEGGLEEVGSLGLGLSASTLDAAAGAGQLAVMQHLRQRGCPWPSGWSERGPAAASNGHTEVCLWLLNQGCTGADWLLPAAAKGGHADTCEQLLAAGCLWAEYAAGKAAAGGHVRLMRRLLQLSEEQPEEWPTHAHSLLLGAAEGLELAELQRLHAQYMVKVSASQQLFGSRYMLDFAALGNTEDYEQKIDWLLGLGYRPRQFDAAFFRWGSTELSECRGPSVSGPALVARLRFLQQRGFPMRHDVARYVLSGKQDEPAAIAYLIDEVGLQPGASASSVAEGAFIYGRLCSLQLLHQRGWLAPGLVFLTYMLSFDGCRDYETTAAWLLDNLCGPGPGKHPCTAELFAAAAQLGSVPLLQQLRERGCPWDARTWGAAARSGCGALLQWLHDAGCPRPVSCAALPSLRQLAPCANGL
jgi:hypothetical protein